MHAVGLVERRIRRDAFQEEGIERRLVLRREIGIDGIELLRIRLTEIGRRQHSGEKHRLAAAGELWPGCRESALRVTAGARPRSASLAPSSTMTMSASAGTDHSTRASPSSDGVAGDASVGDGHVRCRVPSKPLRAARESFRPARARGRRSGCRRAPRSRPASPRPALLSPAIRRKARLRRGEAF